MSPLENLNYGCWYLKWSENGSKNIFAVDHSLPGWYEGPISNGDTLNVNIKHLADMIKLVFIVI